jgi:hypothetical protein
MRGRHWRLRAQQECVQAVRTWFATLTLSPEAQFKFLSVARLRLAKQGLDFDNLPSDEQFAYRVWSISPEITRFLKRVRKQSGAKFRYILVAEEHKSGLPHFHMLLHEVSDEQPIRHHVLKSQWLLGFSVFKLIKNPSAASYVTKYLTKSNASRVRASINYGEIYNLPHPLQGKGASPCILTHNPPSPLAPNANGGYDCSHDSDRIPNSVQVETA